ncbi:hypothetical protein CW713_03495 [Methanophagales archaeon]|nr:MAG: hypothetical protein CW713_03495 [Methanophagales archaeon]
MQKKNELSYYVIPLDENLNIEHTHNAIKLVNSMLDLCVDVWWLQRRLRGEKRVYQKGDFVVTLKSGEKNRNEILINHFLKTADELEITVYPDAGLNESNLITAAKKLVKPVIAAYYGNGTTDGAIWFVQALEKMGFDIGIVTEKDILNGALELENYNVLILGSGMEYCSHLGREGCKKIAEFVNNGGGYIGHCGGAVAAVKGYPKSSSSSWLELADVRLELKENGNILSAYARGPVIYDITMPEHPIMFGYEGNISLIYWWGPIFSSELGKNVSVLATILAPSPDIQMPHPEITRITGVTPSIKELNQSPGKPAILATNYGHGKVVLASPHPESPGSEHSYRLVANEVFFVTSFSENPEQPKTSARFKPDYSFSLHKIANLTEFLLQELKVAKEIVQDFTDKDTIVYGSVAESMLLYLKDSVNRLEKIKRFDTRELAFERITNEYLRSLAEDAMKKQVIALDKINRLAEPETIEAVRNTITFLNTHHQSLNKILELRDKLKGGITDEYANLVKKGISSYKKALDAYKYGVESKILEASFAVTRAEEALGVIN